MVKWKLTEPYVLKNWKRKQIQFEWKNPPQAVLQLLVIADIKPKRKNVDEKWAKCKLKTYSTKYIKCSSFPLTAQLSLRTINLLVIQQNHSFSGFNEKLPTNIWCISKNFIILKQSGLFYLTFFSLWCHRVNNFSLLYCILLKRRNATKYARRMCPQFRFNLTSK